jgi:hypothetical protein
MNTKRWALACAASSVLLVTGARAQTPRSATLSWVAVTKNVEGATITGVTYNIYQGRKAATNTKVQSGLTATLMTLTNLLAGETCWVVTAVANGVESAPSLEVCKSFPQVAPAVVTGVAVI